MVAETSDTFVSLFIIFMTSVLFCIWPVNFCWAAARAGALEVR